MSRFHRPLAFYTLIVSTLAVFIALGSSATAASRIGGAIGTGPGEFRSLDAVAVSASEGNDIYVTDGVNNRVEQFTPAGSFVRAFGWGIVPGAASGHADLTVGSPTITNATTTSGEFVRDQVVTGPGIPTGDRIVSIRPGEIVLSKAPTASGQGVELTATAGPGNVPTNETQTLTVRASSGTFNLSFTSPFPDSARQTTGAISATAGHEEVQSALEALSNIGAGNVSVSGGPGDETGTHPYSIEFTGRYADANVRPLHVEANLSGGAAEASLEARGHEGGGALETCTTACTGEIREQAEPGGIEYEPPTGSPGQVNYPDEIAVDNDPSSETYGDVYVVDQRDYRVERYSPEGRFELMFGGEVDKGPHHPGDLCTAAYIAEGDRCGPGVPGAAPAHFFSEGYPLDWAGGAEGLNNNSIAVGPGGIVYVGDYGRIQEFNPDGEFNGELSLPDSEKQFVTALAIDATGDIYARSAIYGGNGLLSQVPGIREYGPGPLHAFIRTFDAEIEGTEPTHIALDAEGDLIATDFVGGFIRPSCTFSSELGCPEARFRAFRPTGQLYAVFTSPDVITQSPTANPRAIAFGPVAERLYATAGLQGTQYVAVVTPPVAGTPFVKAGSEETNSIEPTTVVMHAVVNPNGYDTNYRVEYVTQQHFEAEEFNNSAKTPLKDLGAVIQDDAVSIPLANLQPGTTYRWRVFAENEKHETAYGEAVSFATLPPVSVRGLTTQTVGPELVTLKAELNPNNGVGTEYTFRYGKTEAYEAGSSHGTLPLGGEFKPVDATFNALDPNTTYHYQLVVKNSYGQEETADKTFTTELSPTEELAAEDCPNGSHHGEPNSTIREEDNSLALPDCRAYEQVTEREKNGGDATFGTLAPSGERLLYGSVGVFAGAESKGIASEYIATRTPSGWVSRAPIARLAPDTEPGVSVRTIYAPELNGWLFTEIDGLSGEEAGEPQTSGFLSIGRADGSYVLHATPTISPLEGAARFPYAFLKSEPGAVSADLSHVIILTGARLLSEDPRPDSDYGNELIPPEYDRLYEVTGAGGSAPSLHLVAELPTGLSAQGEGGGVGGCFLDWEATRVRHHVIPRTISEDGSTFFYIAPIERAEGFGCGEGQPNPYALFARTGEAAPVQLNAPPAGQCAQPHPCASPEPKTPLYDGASPDGRIAWFTTAQPLVNSDADQTNDLYAAKLAPNGELEELVQASAGQATASHPNPGEGADIGEAGVTERPFGIAGLKQGVAAVSADGTHAAFESPAVLTEEPNALGQTAVQHANNLYLYDLNANKIKFVADLCSGPEQSGTEPAEAGTQGYHAVSKEQSVYDPSCPSTADNFVGTTSGSSDFSSWQPNGNGGEVELTPNGGFLLFSSIARLTPDDTDSQRDLFRFDFQTGELTRVSSGHRGNDGNGNDDAYPAEFSLQEEFRSQLSRDAGSISADGAVVLFRTAAPLVSRDTNQTSHTGSCEPRNTEFVEQRTGCDLYMWEADGHGTCTETPGCVSLVSSGHAPNVGDRVGAISASGRDILFQTSRGLVPNDTDGVNDVYDARVEGGFHPEYPPPVCTSPEACGEATTGAPTPPVLGTPNFVGPGNSATHLRCGKGRHRVVKHGQPRCVPNRRHRHGGKPRHHRHHHRGGKAHAAQHRSAQGGGR